MTFKEKYKQEMDAVKHATVLDEKIWKAVDTDSDSTTHKHFRFTPTAVAAAIALVILALNFETVTAYTISLFGSFSLSMGGKEVVLDEIEPLELDYERFLTDVKAEKRGANYYYSYEDFNEGLGIELPGNTFLEYEVICVDVNLEYNVGHLSLDFAYENETFHMNGRFIVSDYAYEELGYGETNKAYYVYEYADGKNAYFVKEWDADYQTVYFSTGEYIFQLFVENGIEGVKMAEEILDSIGSQL